MKRYELLKQAINNHGYCSVDKQNMDMIEKEIRADERAELLDKVAERINSLHYDTCNPVTRRIEHQLKAEVFKVIEEMKAEVEE